MLGWAVWHDFPIPCVHGETAHAFCVPSAGVMARSYADHGHAPFSPRTLPSALDRLKCRRVQAFQQNLPRAHVRAHAWGNIW